MEIEWLNTADAARHLMIKPRTLAQWAREGKVPAHRLSGCQRVVGGSEKGAILAG